MFDVVIIGGGPVGLATALHARRAGLSCALVEQRVGVVDKACGEGLMPAGLQALRALGVDPQGAHRGDPLRGGERSAQAGFGSGPGGACGARPCTLRSPTASARPTSSSSPVGPARSPRTPTGSSCG
ncbi:FAD-dependent oxidoreductase [Janibacter melonis]|uniref:FAD-dependent oxidoreductase n=1 Tax=Janibacter melonis TaxID=262209 RepID=UPI0020946CD3|nr:FAD-dependent oxidoreductase [Janibacter melonis]